MASKKRSSTNNVYIIVGMWIAALLITFVLVGANSRPVLWVFFLGAGVSYYILTKIK